ncbi:MAG TPA: type II CAAX endopeptidase family protein [Bacteroidales bacterium]|nr:type II CAAX endopeptidase family protein [Bacteroidales bacterium]
MKFTQAKKAVLLVLAGFAAYYFLFSYFRQIKAGLDHITGQGLISYILTYVLVGIPIFIGTHFIEKTVSVGKSLGLSSNILAAIWVSLLFTIPMFIGGWIFFKFNTKIDLENLVAGTIVAGFMEELYFRGFLFGQLFRNTKFGFIPSILLGAFIFAAGHLYQSQQAGELAGIFIITFSGAVFFAWLYVEWNYNLWVPILTHSLMNLSWDLFDVDTSALGDLKANIFRGMVILIAIIFTISYKRKRHEKLIINRKNLLISTRNGVKIQQT